MKSNCVSGFILTLLWISVRFSTCQDNVRLVTYVVGADGNDPFSAGISASAQLAPVYSPHGEVSHSSHLGGPTARAIGGGAKSTKFVTETVYGFLDFTTTVGSTVMVFTPQSEKDKKSEPTTLQSSSKVKIVAATPLKVNIESTIPPEVLSKTRTVISSVPTTTSIPTISENPISTNEPTGLAKLLKEALSLREKRIEKAEKPFTFDNAPLRKSLKKPSDNNRKDGGSTIVPITVEGTGKTLFSKTPVLEPSIYIPEEVVISMSQAFPPISVIGLFDTKINNAIESDISYNYLASEPTPSINEHYSVVDFQSKNKKKSKPKPIGLVTTLGGTIISDGHTIVHQTSVIGTYVDGQYAQVLKSTSRIFKDDPLENLITPTPNYETIKSVIEGSATQFFNPEITASLPIESLFSTVVAERAPRQESKAESAKPKLTKRRGTNPYEKDDYYYDAPKDPYYDDYEDLHHAGSGARNVYSSISPTAPLKKSQPSTFRPRQKPTGTRNTPPSLPRNSPPPDVLNRNSNSKFRLSSARPNLKHSRTPPGIFKKSEEEYVPQQEEASEQQPTSVKKSTEETIRVITKKPKDGVTDVWYEIATLRSLHTFRVGATKNTRHVTYTKTFTHPIEATSEPILQPTEKSSIFEDPPLFENILDKPKEVATLPPINLLGKDLNEILKTTTEFFQTIETMYKTSVLPVKVTADNMLYHTLTQTYLITRIVEAIKTIPPFEAFEFIPGDSLNEFNGKLLAEGTENEDSLLPEEREYDENGEVRVRPPPDFKLTDSNLADLAGGKFNPDALEKQLNPELAAALQSHKKSPGKAPELAGTKDGLPAMNTNNGATPPLSPEALQLAYLRLMNPFMFGGFPGAQPQVSLTSSPVVITTDVTLTDTRVLKVIFNARPIYTTISSTEVVRTTITTYSTATVTASPSLPGFGGFPFAGAPLPFPTG